MWLPNILQLSRQTTDTKMIFTFAAIHVPLIENPNKITLTEVY